MTPRVDGFTSLLCSFIAASSLALAKEYAKADDGKPEKKPEKKPVPAPVTSEPKPTDDEEDVIIEVE